MKKITFLGLSIVLLVASSSHIPVKTRGVLIYMIYDGDGEQKNYSNYSQTFTNPGTLIGNNLLWWFRITDNNNGIISQAEFAAAFEAYDVINDSLNTLDDDNEILGQLEKKF